MQISVWEKESFYAPCDVIIAGSGFVGLWSAWFLKQKKPKLRITIVDRGVIPTGASTRNAGFACYGSATELLKDAAEMGELNMLSLVDMRFRGLQRISEVFTKKQIGFKRCGGYELLAGEQVNQELSDKLKWLNKALRPITGERKTFRYADEAIARFGFAGFQHMISTAPEGQLHSGKLCQLLLNKVVEMGVTVLQATEIISFEHSGNGISVQTDRGFTLQGEQLLICTNGFAQQLLPDFDVQPARGQVLVTAPIPGLKFKGTFHFDEGFYYFRNLGDRLLLGGARNMAVALETTTEMNVSDSIQTHLEQFIRERILPGTPFEITDRWSGIMGIGSEKMPIIKKVANDVYCAVRMSGMGVALAPVAGESVAKLMR